jgi:RNA polymerase sigma-70 factor (ECF subfamily)
MGGPARIQDGAQIEAMTDQDILARCLDGDTEAFEDIVRKYQPEVLAIAWSVLGQREEARDAAQEIFVQCFQNLHRYDPGREFKNWLCAIAYKKSLDRRRKMTTFRRLLDRLGPELPPEPGREGESERIQRDMLTPHLRLLRPLERTVVYLKIHEGRSYREIAEILDCSEGSARVHFFNAKKKLKNDMERTSHVPSL